MSVSSRRLEILKRRDTTGYAADWGEWIQWMKESYSCTQKDIAEMLEVTPAMVSRMKRGVDDPPDPIKLTLASYAKDKGPVPPEFNVPPGLLKRLISFIEAKDNE